MRAGSGALLVKARNATVGSSPAAPVLQDPARRPTPSVSLAEAFGPGVAYVRQPALSAARWLPKEPGVVTFLSGGQSALAGRMPVVSNAATVTPDAMACLKDAGFPLDSEFHPYATLAEYGAILRRLAAAGFRLALQTPHEPDEADPRWCLVDPDVQRDLNDKGRLRAYVPEARTPPRTVLPPGDAACAAAGAFSARGKVVLKAANRFPSGAGETVRVCTSSADVARALVEMADEPAVVVEEFLEIERSACVHALVHADGTVGILGVAEQVCDAEGRYRGNWIDRRSDALARPDVLTTVRATVERAARSGYRGFAGIDVAFLADGDWRVLDLNFRVNGSTPAILLRASIEAGVTPRAIRARSWRGNSDFAHLLVAVRAAMDRRALIPLAFYDPLSSPDGGSPRVGGLLLGDSRESVLEEDRALAAAGLS